MNTELQNFARKALLEGLAQLEPDTQRIFKHFYGSNNGKRTREEAEVIPLRDIVNEIPPEGFALAMCMVQHCVDQARQEQPQSPQSD